MLHPMSSPTYHFRIASCRSSAVVKLLLHAHRRQTVQKRTDAFAMLAASQVGASAAERSGAVEKHPVAQRF